MGEPNDALLGLRFVVLALIQPLTCELQNTLGSEDLEICMSFVDLVLVDRKSLMGVLNNRKIVAFLCETKTFVVLSYLCVALAASPASAAEYNLSGRFPIVCIRFFLAP